MKKIALAYCAVLALCMICIYLLSKFFAPQVLEIYQDNLRGSLFSAFLTMGSFTLSLMTMFIFSLKDKLFDDEGYKKKILAYSEMSKKNINRHIQLVNISRLFLFCVFCCFCTSIVQFTIGLFDNYIASSFCLSFAITTLLLSLYILLQVWMNLEVWFNLLLEK